MPNLHDRLATVVESLIPKPTATPHQPNATHRLAAAEIGRGCNHGDLADELEAIAEDLHLLVGQLRRDDRDAPEQRLDHWGRPLSRAVHVEVDDAAWTQLRAALALEPVSIGDFVGRLVRDAVGRRRFMREEGERVERTSGRRARVFVRLMGVDDATWRGFKATAMEHRVTAARLVGLVIEAEARRRGYRSED